MADRGVPQPPPPVPGQRLTRSAPAGSATA